MIDSITPSYSQVKNTPDTTEAKRRAIYPQIWVSMKDFYKKIRRLASHFKIKFSLQTELLHYVLTTGSRRNKGLEICISDSRFDSKKEIGEQLGYSEQQIKTAEKHLRDNGLIETTGKKGSHYRKYAVGKKVIEYFTGQIPECYLDVPTETKGAATPLVQEIKGSSHSLKSQTKGAATPYLREQPDLQSSSLNNPLINKLGNNRFMSLKNNPLWDQLQKNKANRAAKGKADEAAVRALDVSTDTSTPKPQVKPLSERNTLFNDHLGFFKDSYGKFDFKEVYRYWEYCIKNDVVDEGKKVLRRLHGVDKPTAGQGADKLRMSHGKYIDYLIGKTKPESVTLAPIETEEIMTEQQKEDRKISQLIKMKKLKEDLKMSR